MGPASDSTETMRPSRSKPARRHDRAASLARLALIGLAVLASGCAATGRDGRGAPAREALGAPPAEHGRPERASGSRVGLASWYGRWHQGRRTASGEAYDMNGLTAAHRTIPFGTRVRVTNLRNGRSAVVRVNDRGPYVPRRILDVSLGAAKALDMVDDGVVRVEIVVIPAGG